MTMPRPGERLPFVFPPDQIHFFDPESHLAIWQ
jgi:hypothetical protein